MILKPLRKKMAEIVDRDETISREVWTRADATKFFESLGETFKAEHVGNLPEDAEISLYRQGNWVDLCAGPHLPSTGKLGKAFKLMKLAGTNWRGDPNNPKLQRIYGTCWRTEKELKAYLHRLEQAAMRDHRQAGPRDGPVPHPGGGPRSVCSGIPNGWTLYTDLRGLHAPPSGTAPVAMAR